MKKMEMTGTLLEQSIDAWLPSARRQIVPRFPPLLEASFQAENARAKLLALRVCASVGMATGVLVVPSLWRLMPDAHTSIIWLWCLGVLPMGLASSLVLLTRLPIAVQEGQIAATGIAVAGWFTAMMASAQVPQPAVYLGGMILLVMLNVVAAGFSFSLAAIYGAILVALFGAGLSHMHAGIGHGGALLQLIMTMCTCFALFGCWRVESETRHSFARMLRERGQQQALAARNAELDHLALRDPLTGLANRRAYQSWQAGAWRTAEASAEFVGLIMVDIDHFKKFNDYYGHPAGDACLQAVARCMAEQLRGTTDLVARIGGEEFAILLPGTTLAASGDVAERLRIEIEALELPHGGCGPGAAVTISCGASAALARAGISLADLSEGADAALYEAKQAGRNRVCLAERQAGADASHDNEALAQG